MAARVWSPSLYLPVPTMRREEKVRPAMTSGAKGVAARGSAMTGDVMVSIEDWDAKKRMARFPLGLRAIAGGLLRLTRGIHTHGWASE